MDKLQFTNIYKYLIDDTIFDDYLSDLNELINSVKEECSKIVDWDEKLFKLWWNKMSKGANKDELIEERLARNIWMAASCYFVEAIRDSKE